MNNTTNFRGIVKKVPQRGECELCKLRRRLVIGNCRQVSIALGSWSLKKRRVKAPLRRPSPRRSLRTLAPAPSGREKGPGHLEKATRKPRGGMFCGGLRSDAIHADV